MKKLLNRFLLTSSDEDYKALLKGLKKEYKLRQAMDKLFNSLENQMKAKKTAKRIKAKTVQAASPVEPRGEIAVNAWLPIDRVMTLGLHVMRSGETYEIVRVVRVISKTGAYNHVLNLRTNLDVHQFLASNSTYQAIKEE